MEITLMPAHPNRNGFTLLELIFVIVILGIVASIGSELIVKVYQQYIVQRAQHRASLKTELAALQIANRLASAIPGTVYRVRTNDSYEPINSAFPTGITGDHYKGLRWVGADTDSFNANSTPGWSGFCDLDSPSTTATTGGNNILTPGSDLVLASNIIGNLEGNITNASIYFPDLFSPVPLEYNVSSVSGSTIITLGATPSGIIREHYKLAWTSYALVVDQTDGHLYLHYNFPPTPGVNGTAVPGSTSLLMKNISTFKFKGDGRTIRFKICKEEEIGEDYNITACKEKAVF